MAGITYTHAEMVKISDKAKRLVLNELEEAVKNNVSKELGGFNLISREGVLKDIEIIRANNGL